MSKILTITVPSYNTEKYMDSCLPTLLHDEINEKLEIILVNDGSKDNTLEKARSYEAKYPNTIRVVDKENGGHGSTINKGIELATGKYFKVVDGDDWVNTSELMKLIEKLEKVDVDIVVSPYEDHNMDTGEVKKQAFTVDKANLEMSYDELVEQANRLPMMHATTFKTEVLQKNNIVIDENSFYVDMEYIIFPIPYLKTAMYIDTTVYCYRMGTAEQSVNPKNFIKNRHMHRNVTLQLIRTYLELRSKMPNAPRTRILGHQILHTEINLDTNIHLMVEGGSAKQELMDYYRDIKDLDSQLLSQTSGKKIRLINQTNGFVFPFISYWMRKRNADVR